MECNSNFADGHCAADDTSFYVHTRHHNASQALLDFARHQIEMRTHHCFDVSKLYLTDHTGRLRSKASFYLEKRLRLTDF